MHLQNSKDGTGTHYASCFTNIKINLKKRHLLNFPKWKGCFILGPWATLVQVRYDYGVTPFLPKSPEQSPCCACDPAILAVDWVFLLQLRPLPTFPPNPSSSSAWFCTRRGSAVGRLDHFATVCVLKDMLNDWIGALHFEGNEVDKLISPFLVFS